MNEKRFCVLDKPYFFVIILYVVLWRNAYGSLSLTIYNINENICIDILVWIYIHICT
jgi:hypothetical protein